MKMETIEDILEMKSEKLAAPVNTIEVLVLLG